MSNGESGTAYLTTIRDVGEVTLAGAADAEFWREHLAGQRLFPYLAGGRAQLALGGTRLRWMGLRFRELTLSVGVCNRPQGDSNDGWYLAAAFNSSALLAALERGMFQTPYLHAALRVEGGAYTRIELSDARGTRLAAQTSGHEPVQPAVESWWQGPIFLPSASGSRGRYFRARLGGPISTFAWDSASDRLELPRPDDPMARLLADSRFQPLEWRIRASATHARSRTYSR